MHDDASWSITRSRQRYNITALLSLMIKHCISMTR